MDASRSAVGMPVLEKPGWTNVQFGNNLTVTFQLIGDSIVYAKPVGYATLPELKKILRLVLQVVHETMGEDRSYAHVADYSDLQGISVDARRHFISFLKTRPGLVGIVFFGVPPVIRVSIKLGTRLHGVRGSLTIVDTLDQAVVQAQAMLARHATRTGASLAGFDFVEPSRPGQSIGSVRRPEWKLELRGFTIDWEIIDGRVMHATSSGCLRSEHMEPIFELNTKLAEFVRGFGSKPSIIVGIKELDRVTAAGRKNFIDALRDWQQNNPLELIAFYGANPLLRGALAISRPFLPFELKAAKNLKSALELVPGPAERRLSLVKKRRPSSSKHKSPGSATRLHIDDLLHFLGNINWEHDGTDLWDEPVAASHPLAAVFDAITLIKSDVDHLFQQRRKAEEALRESKERYRTILENIVDGYYEIDLEGNLSFCNDEMLRMLGYKRDEITKLSTRAFMSKEHAKRVMSAFNRVYETGRPARVLDWELIRRDGNKIAVEASISIIEGPGGDPVGFRGIVRDVTERARADRERMHLEAQLRQAQRMEAIGTLAGGIAHNFNNLLMGIQGNVSLMRAEIDPRNPHHHRLETIESLVQGGSKLTSQLLGFARAGRYEVRAIDINELVAKTAETFALTRREIRVHQDTAPELLPVRADRGQIEQILLNLFINAAEAMPTGGDLFVKTLVTTHDELRGKQYEPKPGSYVVVSVRDTGVGMDEETARRVFEPFFTTKGLSGGTGLGLASVYGTVKAHGGYVDVRSKVGMGSTFSIYLPATREAVFAPEDTKGEIVIGRGTVLVVDDDEAVLEACASILEYLEYTPLRAASGRKAIEIFTNHSDHIDMVILDMILPDMGGGEVFDALKSIDSGVKVLLASGYALNGAAEDIMRRGCNDFIQKPFTIQQLSQKIGTIITPVPVTTN